MIRAEKRIFYIRIEKVDFIITHCGPTSSMALYSHGEYNPDILTNYFEEIRQKVDFKNGLWDTTMIIMPLMIEKLFCTSRL